MKVLALDITTNAGWALLEGQMGAIPKILETGTITNDGPVSSYGKYPWSLYKAAFSVANQLWELYCAKGGHENLIDAIVIEEVNKPGRFGSRFSQKLLDAIHCIFIGFFVDRGVEVPLIYINTADWRKVVGAHLTKADKALNAKVRKLKKAGDKEGLKKLGVRGKIGKKHVAVRYINQTYSLSFKQKDHDICDAICQGVAYFLGVKHCDGK